MKNVTTASVTNIRYIKSRLSENGSKSLCRSRLFIKVSQDLKVVFGIHLFVVSVTQFHLFSLNTVLKRS